MSPSTQKMLLLVLGGVIAIVILLGFISLLSRARTARNNDTNTIIKVEDTPIPIPIPSSTINSEPVITTSPTPTIEDEAKSEANTWINKRFSPANGSNQRCGAQKEDNIIVRVLLLEELKIDTVLGGGVTSEVEQRNSGNLWSGQVKFIATPFKIYTVTLEGNKLSVDKPEWESDFSCFVNVVKNKNGWKISRSTDNYQNKTYSDSIDSLNPFPCSDIIALNGKSVKVSTPTPEITPTPQMLEKQTESYKITAFEAERSVKKFLYAAQYNSNASDLRELTTPRFYSSIEDSLRIDNLTVEKALRDSANKRFLFKAIGIPDVTGKTYTTGKLSLVSVDRKPYTANIEIEINGQFYTCVVTKESLYSSVLVDEIRK